MSIERKDLCRYIHLSANSELSLYITYPRSANSPPLQSNRSIAPADLDMGSDFNVAYIYTLVLTVELLSGWVCPYALYFQRRKELLPRRYPIIASGRLNHNIWHSIAKFNTTIPRTQGLTSTITKPLVCVIQRYMGLREVSAQMVEAE